MLWFQTKDDLALREKALAGLRRYQHAQRPEPPALTLAVEVERARLLRPSAPLGDSIPQGTPVVLIPSLINPPGVMDISQERSLLRHVLRSGHDALLLDWGHPSPDERDRDLAGHIEELLLPLLAQLGRPAILLGYCLGGTLALGAAAAATDPATRPRAVATIATPWHFHAYDDAFRTECRRIWDGSREVCEHLGQVPMEVLQMGFWSLDPGRTVAKFAAFASMDEASSAYAAFITLEDWANAGAPLTLSAGRQLIEQCYGEDMPGRGLWTIGGRVVDPASLDCPTLAIASTTDRIVPAGAAPPADERFDLALGHVGMMVGSRAQASLFDPLTAWIARHSD